MDKRKPHNELVKVKALIRAGQYHVTRTALGTASKLDVVGKKAIGNVLLTHREPPAMPGALYELALHKESKIVEGHMMGDHVHMCLSIPPKHAVSDVVGYLKGKSAIQIARKFGGGRRTSQASTFGLAGILSRRLD